jgi:hypothetical protein
MKRKKQANKDDSSTTPHRIRVIPVWHPDRLDKPHPLVIDALLQLVNQGKTTCLSKLIQMNQDLCRAGLRSRYCKHLFDALYELKDTTGDGGARLYFIRGNHDTYYIFHAECKKETATDDWILGTGLEILEALERGDPVQPARFRQKRP